MKKAVFAADFIMMQSEERHISLDMIRCDSTIASREEENDTLIQHFAQIMQDGGNYPSIMCFFDGEYYSLIYGLNLLKAAELTGQKTILVDVHANPYSYQRKDPDKGRAVKKLLSLLEAMGEDEKLNWSTRRIADLCVVAKGTVTNCIEKSGYKAPKEIKAWSKHSSKNYKVNTSGAVQSNQLRSKESRFNWTAIDDKQFEELIYEVVNAKNPTEIKWRSGPGGKGRDIEARFNIQGSLEEYREERYFIEAKHFKTQGVNSGHIQDVFYWAHAEKPTVLVIAVSTHLTADCRDSYIPIWKKNNPGIEVVIWERKDIEKRILSQESTKKLALQFKLVGKFIR